MRPPQQESPYRPYDIAFGPFRVVRAGSDSQEICLSLSFGETDPAF